MQKKFLALFLLLFVMLSPVGCNKENNYTLSQSFDNIQNVEIVYVANNDILVKGFYDSIKLISAVEKEEWGIFFEEFYAIKCSRYLNDPAESVTGEVIRITYDDGSFELIGMDAVFYCANDKDWDYFPYYFEKNAFYKLINSSTGDGTV